MELKEIIVRAMNASLPINVDGRPVDLDQYVYIAGDGNFSNTGFKYYYNPKNGSLIRYNWSRWQRDESVYVKSTIADYVDQMMCYRDKAHFERFIDGLEKIKELADEAIS
jgi:hypothetical protein